MAQIKDTVPPWRIVPPAPADELLAYYRDAEAASGVGWNYLAAINLIETRFGSIDGASTAGAQGPMQFLPATFSAYSDGGDIHSPRDSIMAAGRYLAANGFANDRDHAIFRYNNAAEYVRAVDDYAALLAADPAAFAGYYRWDTYYYTTAGDVLLPIGYASTSPIPVETTSRLTRSNCVGHQEGRQHGRRGRGAGAAVPGDRWVFRIMRYRPWRFGATSSTRGASLGPWSSRRLLKRHTRWHTRARLHPRSRTRLPPDHLAGRALPHVWLGKRDGRTISTHDLAGHGRFCLLTGISGTAWADAAAAVADKLGIDVAAHVIGPAREYQDLYEDWARAREVGEDGCVLVRPDMHIAWRANAMADDPAAELLDVMSRVLALPI